MRAVGRPIGRCRCGVVAGLPGQSRAGTHDEQVTVTARRKNLYPCETLTLRRDPLPFCTPPAGRPTSRGRCPQRDHSPVPAFQPSRPARASQRPRVVTSFALQSPPPPRTHTTCHARPGPSNSSFCDPEGGSTVRFCVFARKAPPQIQASCDLEGGSTLAFASLRGKRDSPNSSFCDLEGGSTQRIRVLATKAGIPKFAAPTNLFGRCVRDYERKAVSSGLKAGAGIPNS